MIKPIEDLLWQGRSGNIYRFNKCSSDPYQLPACLAVYILAQENGDGLEAFDIREGNLAVDFIDPSILEFTRSEKYSLWYKEVNHSSVRQFMVKDLLVKSLPLQD